MFRYRVTAINRIDFNTDTWTLPLETRYKLEFTHRVVKSSSNNGYNTTTGADIDLRRPAIQNVSRSRLRVTSRFQTTCGSVSVLRFSFIGIIRRTKTLTIVLPPVGRKGKFYTVIRRNSTNDANRANYSGTKRRGKRRRRAAIVFSLKPGGLYCATV